MVAAEQIGWEVLQKQSDIVKGALISFAIGVDAFHDFLKRTILVVLGLNHLIPNLPQGFEASLGEERFGADGQEIHKTSEHRLHLPARSTSHHGADHEIVLPSPFIK